MTIDLSKCGTGYVFTNVKVIKIPIPKNSHKVISI